MIELSVAVFGKGVKEQSHWAFMLRRHKASAIDASEMIVAQSTPLLLAEAELLHVVLLDSRGQYYQFETRPADSVSSKAFRGRCVLANLPDIERKRVVGLLERTAAPCDGVKTGQEWIVDAMIELEVAELVPGGMSEFFWNLRRQSSADIARAADGLWMPT